MKAHRALGADRRDPLLDQRRTEPVAAVGVRRGDDVGSAGRGSHAEHRHAFLDGLRPIVEAVD